MATWLLHAVALLGLALGLSFIAAVLLLAQFPRFIDGVINGRSHLPEASFAPAIVLIGLTLGAIYFGVRWFWARPHRGLLYSALLVASLLVVDVVAIAFCQPLGSFTEPPKGALVYGVVSDPGIVVLLLALATIGVFAALWRLRSWWWISAGYLALAAVLTYLATDDPAVLHPVTLAQISPTFPGAEASYDVLMRYGKQHPLGHDFKNRARIFDQGKFVDANKPVEWPAWLASHREAVEADWADLAPVRAWIDELSHFDRIGDLMPARLDAEIITFSPLRSYAQHAAAIAGTQAIAGHGDDAIATLLPLIQVSRKLEPYSRSLVRTMIARVMQNVALSTARFVLDTTPVSPEMRERLVTAFTDGTGGETGVRHLLATENALFAEANDELPLGDLLTFQHPRGALRWSMNLVGPFLYNRHRTANLRSEFTTNLQELAGRRDMEAFSRAQTAFFERTISPRFKNFMGNSLLTFTTPSYTQVVTNYWKIEDARIALLGRLAGTLP
ncbi:MAG: hypothetical protein ABI273_07480 [Lacunisphaera sp.]